MPGHDIICIGASAGGVEVLIDLMRELPADLPAAVFVVVHVAPNSSTVLPAVLNRAGKLPASHASPDEPIRKGRIYVARPDMHLLVKDGEHPRVVLGRGPKENSARPAVDPLFRSAARAFGPRVIGVVLSGSLDDGTVGLDVIKRAGGIAVVQDPEEALFPGMPRSAVENVAVDHIIPRSQIASLLVRLANEPVPHVEVRMSNQIKQEADMAELDAGSIQSHDRPGTPSGFTCPECHGTLFELSEGHLIRFRCRTGHAYSAESLMAEQGDNLEAAMYTAMTALKERSALADRLSQRARERGHEMTARQFEEQAKDAERQAELIRQALLAATTGPQSGPLPSEGDREATRAGQFLRSDVKEAG
jgi:two-component system, chemotaxis family, protein-glutamate methylesterase/glutaminase